MSEFIFDKGRAIECIGNPAQKTQFRIFCEDPHHNDIMVGLPEDGRKFANWSDVIAAATKQARSRIIRIEVYEVLVYERDQPEKLPIEDVFAIACFAGLLVFTIYKIYTTMWDYVPTGFMGKLWTTTFHTTPRNTFDAWAAKTL